MSNQVTYTTETIFDMVFHQKRNVFITAEGGAGKSYLLKQLYEHARQKGMDEDECILTSTTGVSAYNIGGQTIHSWSGILLPKNITEMDAETLQNSIKAIQQRLVRRKKVKMITKAKLLLVDEISMLGGYYLEVMDQILRLIRKVDSPLGGLQLVTTGDMCQLPPVGDVFLFESEVWEDMKNCTFYLETFYRFTDENWIRLLSRCRLGELTAQDKELLRSRLVNKSWYNETEGIRPTIILPTNKKVEEINTKELDRIKEEAVYFEAEDHVCTYTKEEIRTAEDTTYSNTSEEEELPITLEELEKLNNGFPIDRVLKLKIGCQVMLRRNLNVSTGLVNGTRGILKAINNREKGILVQFENYYQHDSTISWGSPFLPASESQVYLSRRCRPTPDTEWIFPVTFAFEEVKGVEKKESGLLQLNPRKQGQSAGHKVELRRTYNKYERVQYPLCLSAAISIHKSQGITLSSIAVDVGSSIFSAGQSYVALSRCKSLEGVHLLNLDTTKIRADQSAKRYDRKLRQSAMIVK